jgi:tetratricopeptide (TPR) repeat protein
VSRTQWLLLAVIVTEWAVGGPIAFGRLRQGATPPVPDLTMTDSVTADELRAKAAQCRTPDQWADLGEVYLATGFFPEGEACLREAIALGATNADFAFKHAFALERLGRLEDANAEYEAAVRLNHPRAADCWYYVGKNYLRREQADSAATAFERARPLPGARYESALLQARAGHVAQAHAEARRLSGEFPSAFEPVSLRYRLALARNDVPAADALADEFARRPQPLRTPFYTEVDWVTARANGVGRSRIYHDAGRAMQSGRVAEAEAGLRKLLAVGWAPEVADRLAEVLFATGRQREASEVLADSVDRGGPSYGQLWLLGQAYDATGQSARALETWERAARLATGPWTQGLWQDLTRGYERTGDRDRASAFRAKAQLAAGMNLLDAGKPSEAVTALRQAVEADPGLAHAWYALGEAYRARQRPAEARAAYERCLAIDPYHGRARRALKLLTR